MHNQANAIGADSIQTVALVTRGVIARLLDPSVNQYTPTHCLVRQARQEPYIAHTTNTIVLTGRIMTRTYRTCHNKPPLPAVHFSQQMRNRFIGVLGDASSAATHDHPVSCFRVQLYNITHYTLPRPGCVVL